MSTVWEKTDDRSKKFRFAPDIYLMTIYIFLVSAFGHGALIWMLLGFLWYMYQNNYVRNPYEMGITHNIRKRRCALALVYMKNRII